MNAWRNGDVANELRYLPRHVYVGKREREKCPVSSYLQHVLVHTAPYVSIDMHRHPDTVN